MLAVGLLWDEVVAGLLQKGDVVMRGCEEEGIGECLRNGVEHELRR